MLRGKKSEGMGMNMKKELQKKKIITDVLVIGGGSAGCYAALTISRKSGLSVLIAEKANIKRSGCLPQV